MLAQSLTESILVLCDDKNCFVYSLLATWWIHRRWSLGECSTVRSGAP